jgi:hypothetical protein
MEYILILNPNSRCPEIATDSHGFSEKFAEYETAKQSGNEYKLAGDCNDFSVYGLCNDDRNHVI